MLTSSFLNDLVHSTTKGSGKLKILPQEPENNSGVRPSQFRNDSDEESSDDDDDDDDGDEKTGAAKSASRPDRPDREQVYKQLAQIPEGSMRRDARRLTRRGRASLPRVTAYSTAT